MATRGTYEDTDALLHHPDVLRVVRAIFVAFGFRDYDIEDGTGEVEKRALEKNKPGERPTTVEGWIKVARQQAYDVAREMLRTHYSRGKRNAGLTDGADDHASPDSNLLDPNERARVREVVDEVRREMAGGKHTDVMLAGLMTGAPPREMAKDAGIKPAQMRKATSEFRGLLRSKLAVVGISLAGAALICWGSVEAYEFHQEQVRGESFDANCAIPPPVQMRDEPPRMRDLPREDKAAQFRERGLAECAQKDWEHCSNDLDVAAMYDRSGEDLPEVKAARAQLALFFSTKPRRLK
jgi:hypothetical protein